MNNAASNMTNPEIFPLQVKANPKINKAGRVVLNRLKGCIPI